MTKSETDDGILSRDPLANSFISSITEHPADDSRLVSTTVDRTEEEDEEFGIAHLKLHGEDGVTHAETETEDAVEVATVADTSNVA